MGRPVLAEQLRFHSHRRRSLLFPCVALALCGFLIPCGEAMAGSVLVEEAAHYRDLGRQYQADNQIDQALDAYAKATLCYPGYADAHNDLGVMYEARGEPALAEIEYLKTLQIDPRHVAAHTNLASLYEAQGKIEDAIPHWQERVRLGPAADPWVRQARDFLIKHKAKVPESLSAKAAKRGGEVALSYEEGRFYLDRNRWAEAEQAFEKALSLDPNHAGARAGLEAARRKLPTKKPSVPQATAAPASAIPAVQPSGRAGMVRPPEDTQRRQEEIKLREQARLREEAEALRREAARLQAEAATKQRRDEAEQLLKQAGELLKQAEAIEQQAKGQQTVAAELIAKSAALRKQAEELRRQAESRLGQASLSTVPPVTRPKTMRVTSVGALPAAPSIGRPSAPIVAPREHWWSKLKFWGRKPEPEEVVVPVAPLVTSAPRPSMPSPTMVAPTASAAPVKPISTQGEAKILAQQLAQERQRMRDLMAREFFQRGLILYRQGQYVRAIEQFQRALTINPDHRDSQQYLRDAQTELARGGR